MLAVQKNGRGSISTLEGPPASVQHIAQNIHRLSAAFPQMGADFFNILAERIAKRGLSAARLQYAIDQVIDNFTYQRLTIADVMSIDSRVELMTYSEMISECNKRGCSTNEYMPIYIGDEKKPFWVSLADKKKFNLPERL